MNEKLKRTMSVTNVTVERRSACQAERLVKEQQKAKKVKGFRALYM